MNSSPRSRIFTLPQLCCVMPLIALAPTLALGQDDHTVPHERQESAPACTEVQSESRFVSVDPWTVHGRNRTPAYADRFKNKTVDTAFVGQHRTKILGRRWYIRFADDETEYGVRSYDIVWRQIAPAKDAVGRFQHVIASSECLPSNALKELRRPPPPHEVTYDDIIFAQMEPSYITLPWAELGLPAEQHRDLEDNGPVKSLGLLYEAVIAPPFLIRDPRWPWSVAVTPRVVLRQFSGGSAPVPPPSYMPRATLFYWGPGLRWVRGLDPQSFPYAWFMVGHHSNGQEGDPIDQATGKPNYATGNFSTNFVELGLSESRSAATAGFVGMQVSAEYHPDAWADSHQRLYGHGRIRVADDAVLPFKVGSAKSARLRAELTWMGGPMGDAFHTLRRRFNYSLTYMFNPLAQDLSTFVNAYDGQDYYNIRYDRRIRIVRVGFIATSLHFKFGVPKIP